MSPIRTANKLAQVTLSTTATALYTTEVFTTTQVTEIWMANTNTTTERTVTLYAHGLATTNIISTIIIPASSAAPISNARIVLNYGEVLGAKVDTGTDVTLTAYGIKSDFTTPVSPLDSPQYPKYGIRYNSLLGVVTRIGSSVGKVADISPNINDFDGIAPWSVIKRCNLADDGVTVNAYYGDAGFKEDGSNGQVMVEYTEFYYSRKQADVYNEDIYVSEFLMAGLKRHPWFYDVNGLPIKKRYFSAYEGSLFDVSATAYLLADEQVADFTATTGDKLCSIAGVKPVSGVTQNLTLPNSRIIAVNRGTGWQQQYFNAVSAIQMLLTVEYASLNSQSAIGQGVVDLPSGTENESVVTGATSSLGNKSGRAVGTDGLVSVSYRGIENFWGNIYKWVDGFNIQNGFAYISNINGNFVSDTFTGQYVKVGELAHTDGYMSKALLNYNFDHGYLPAEALGTSSSKYADYYRQISVGAFVALLGGYWHYGADAGAFYWILNDGSSDRRRTIGARLCC